jgi:hypothetical protein
MDTNTKLLIDCGTAQRCIDNAYVAGLIDSDAYASLCVTISATLNAAMIHRGFPLDKALNRSIVLGVSTHRSLEKGHTP